MADMSTSIYLLLFCFISVLGVDADCPSNWLRHDQSCYHFSHGKLSWISAIAMCKIIGGESSSLVEITEAAEMAFLDRSVASYHSIFWVGGHDSNEENIFVWAISREKIGVNNFAPGNPSDSNGDENCMTIMENGQWNDDDCMKPHRFICEKPPIEAAVIG